MGRSVLRPYMLCHQFFTVRRCTSKRFVVRVQPYISLVS
jgi:hypothetical protein